MIEVKINKEVQSYNKFLLSEQINRNPKIHFWLTLFCRIQTFTTYPHMKPSKRMNTNQTNNSNKKSTQIPNDNPSFQLPKIQKTSNYDTTSNISYDLDFNEEKQLRYPLDEIEQNQKEEFGVVNYDKMTMEEIKHEYQRLREEVTTLSSEVKKKTELFHSKIMKKHISRTSNPIQTQRMLAQTQNQVYENNQILLRLRQQYEQLQKRSNLANSSISRPNAEMNQKILSLREKILTIKEKIKLLRRKTKKTGNDIVDGENIHEVLEKLDRQLKSYQAKQANLQAKIDGSKYKIDRQDDMLNEIEKAHSDAEDYLKLFKLQNEQISEKNTLVQEHKQRIHKQQILRKKIESDQQTCLQKYHQLLKLLELQTQKQQKINKKLIDGDIKILKASNTILDLEKQLQQLQDITQRMNEQINLKKEAELLRNAMERNEAFMTQNGFSLTSHSLNSHIVGVNSIMEENQSQVKDTIQNTDQKDTQTIQTSSIVGNNNNARVKNVQKKDKMMFTKVQTGNQSLPKKQNHSNATAKVISEQNSAFTDAKYYLSSKQISKKRQEQKNATTLRKQSSTNDNKNGRKVYSLIKPNDATKLKELSMNRTTNKEKKDLKIPNIREDIKEKDGLPKTAKQPYISVNRNLNERQEKGKQSLRQRKSSLKIVLNTQNDPSHQVKKNLLDELDQINRQLQANTNQNFNFKSQTQTIESQKMNKQEMLDALQRAKPGNEKQKQKPSSKGRVSQQISNRAQFTGKIVKPSSKQGRLIKPDSKQGKIRHQVAIKPELLSEIDKMNMEYTQKIQEMKHQLINKDRFQEGSFKNIADTKATTLDPHQQTNNINELKQPFGEQPSYQKIEGLTQPQQGPIRQTSITHYIKKDEQDESEISDDGDIEDDFSDINKMIKQKLQAQQINAE